MFEEFQQETTTTPGLTSMTSSSWGAMFYGVCYRCLSLWTWRSLASRMLRERAELGPRQAQGEIMRILRQQQELVPPSAESDQDG
eukprot:4455935-Pyramimonas_sp.AAC.2